VATLFVEHALNVKRAATEGRPYSYSCTTL